MQRKQCEPAALRFDVVAGLTARRSCCPRPWPTRVAGLPVAIGLYTAFIPMVVYALLARRACSRQLHHHARHPGRNAARPGRAGRRPFEAHHATATLTVLVGAMLLVARLLKLGFVANFISTPVLTASRRGSGW